MFLTAKAFPFLLMKTKGESLFGLIAMYDKRTSEAGLFKGIVRSGCVAYASILRTLSLVCAVFRLATSEILSPVCRMSSIMAAILTSLLTTSRSALYSSWERNLGRAFSILGWATDELGIGGNYILGNHPSKEGFDSI